MITFATRGRGQPPAMRFYRGPVIVSPEQDGAPATFGVTALAPPSGVEPASGLEQSRSSTGAGDLQ